MSSDLAARVLKVEVFVAGGTSQAQWTVQGDQSGYESFLRCFRFEFDRWQRD